MRSLPWCRLAPVLLLLACDSPSEPRDDGEPLIPLHANPANATVTVQGAHAVTATMPLTGGTMVATGSDGTVYTLSIPADALIAETTITMTPIASLAAPGVSGGRPAGVQLEPEELRLLAAATLLVAPPEGPGVHAIGMSYHGTGQEIHRAPITPDPTKLEMHLLHFSGHLVYLGDGNWTTIPLEGVTPTDWADRLDSVLEEYLRGERERLLRGEDSDPRLAEILENAAREYWVRVVEPMLNRMMTDCAYAESTMHYALGWSRQVSLLGMEASFVTEQARVTSTLVAALENCWGETIGDCIDEGDATQVQKAFGYSRQLALLGVEDPRYNPLNPDIYCGADWAGTATATGPLPGSTSGPVETLTTSVSFRLDAESSDPELGIYAYPVLEGTIEWSLSGMSASGCSYTGSDTFTLGPDDGVLALYLGQAPPVYSAQGAKLLYGAATMTCPGGEPQEVEWPVGPWLYIDAAETVENPTSLSGSATVNERTFTWNFTR